MGVTGMMLMIRWICGKTWRNGVRNKNICEIVGVAPVNNKLRENSLKWFVHSQ